MEVQLKTLTPLWTGGVDGKVDRIHETGILGSLRWWYEALVRGLGGKACDSSKGECSFDAEKYRNSSASDERQRLRDANLCDVCQVFGATGWRRRFRLSVTDRALSDASIQHTIEAARSHTDRKGKQRTPTWYFRDPTQRKPLPNTPKEGEFVIEIQSLFPEFPSNIIAGLVQFIADWAAIGARTQMGFGVVEPVNGRFDTRPLYDRLVAASGNQKYPDLPSLQNIFLARIQLKNATDQDTFNLKYDLRRLFAQNKDLRHFIMGTVRARRVAAKVKMSRPHGDGLMRVWGWIPEEANVYKDAWNRDKVVYAIHDYLSSKYDLQVWREMNSPRDTVMRNSGDTRTFLRNLLGLQEEGHAV
jgi:CRISPR-associated protein Cmr1